MDSLTPRSAAPSGGIFAASTLRTAAASAESTRRWNVSRPRTIPCKEKERVAIYCIAKCLVRRLHDEIGRLLDDRGLHDDSVRAGARRFRVRCAVKNH